MARRIFRDVQYEDIYQKLSEGDDAVFTNLTDVFLMALCIGYKNGQRKKLSKRGKEFTWIPFTGNTGESIINAIALSETNDFRVIIEQQEEGTEDRETIIEEYANAGIEYLKSEVLDKGGSPVENMLAYINSQREEKGDNIFSLDDMLL